MSIANLLSQLSQQVPFSDSDRYSLYPIKDKETYDFTNKHIATIWFNGEMDFFRDAEDYQNLPPAQKKIVQYLLAFFSSADGAILQNLAFRFILEAQTLEERSFYIVQQFMEYIHSESYSLAIDTIIEDPDEKKQLFEAANNHRTVVLKNKFMEKYIYSDIEKVYRLVAFTCSEGIFFISAFLMIFWFRSQGKMENLIYLNEQISKDETLHKEFGEHMTRKHIELLKLEGKEVSVEKIVEIVREAVEVEVEFIKDILPENLQDLTQEIAISYVHRLANIILVNLGYEAIYEEAELPTWINDLAMQQKSNLYEVGGGNYRNSNIGRENSDEDTLNF